MQIDEREIPTLDTATLEQALRWLHFRLPPREERFERLLEYPKVLENDSDGAWNTLVPIKSVEKTARKLLLDLNLGKLVATADYREWDVSNDKSLYTDFYDFSNWKGANVPCEFWGQLSSWDNPELLKIENDYLELIYRNISIYMHDLKELYPKSDKQKLSTYKVQPTATLEQSLRWIVDKHPPLDREAEYTAKYKNLDMKVKENDRLTYQFKNQYKAILDTLIRCLKNGRLKAYAKTFQLKWDNINIGEDRATNFDFKLSIPVDVWGNLNYKSSQYRPFVYDENRVFPNTFIFFDDLYELFPLEPNIFGISEDHEERPTYQPNKVGRPKSCEKEVWLERLAILSLQNKIDLNDSHEAISLVLKEDLDKLGIKTSSSTIKRDWIGPIIRKARD